MEIHFEGRITRQDFFKAHLLHMRPAPISIALRAFIGGLLLIFAIWLAVTNPGNWQALALVAFPLLVATVPWWMPIYKASSFNRKDNPLADPIEGAANHNGVVMSGPRFKSMSRWDMFTHHKRSPEMVLLYQGKHGFNFIPRGLFGSEADWNAFNRLVENHTSYIPHALPKKAKR